MEAILFEWDEKKNTSNKKKHSISFEEGQTVFVDENALLIHDPDHSDEEERFVKCTAKGIGRLSQLPQKPNVDKNYFCP
jgi:uncharacterized protein